MAQMRTASSTSPLLSPNQLKSSTQRCSICNEIFGLPRPDGKTETASILPCSHVFGSICIMRWLETEAPNRDCPHCRRTMVYRRCRHLIKPCDIARAPNCIPEKDMPEECIVCRGSGKLAEALRLRNERRILEESALEGLRTHLPSIYGGMCRNTIDSLDSRIEEVRKTWRADVDALCNEFEEKEGREQW